ncbi:MAG: response regulator [Candidatus Heimdallarchaeota archaeon]
MAKIMIVDDMVVIQKMLREILSIKGHQVVFTASNGQQAIDYFSNPNNEQPEIVIMDHRMPGKDGLNTSKEFLAIDNSVKIIFVSADESVREEALTSGASDYLIKPITIRSMLNIIENLVS